MSNELTCSGSIIQNDTEDATPNVNALLVSVNSELIQRGRMSVTASDVLIFLGPLGSQTLGWYFFKNLSTTVTITVKTTTSGTAILSLLPGEFAMGRFGSGVTVPAIVGSAAESYVFDYKIFGV